MKLKNKMKNTHSIKFGIEYKDPIELIEFTNSLKGFSNQYIKFINDEYGSEQPLNPKLHIEKIKEGSIITTLVEYSEFSIPFLADVNTFVEFGKSLKTLYSYFLEGKKEDEEIPKYDFTDLKNISDIIKPSTNFGNKIEIKVEGDGNNVFVLNVDDIQASAITEKINKEKILLSTPKTNTYKKELFYFEQAKKDINSKVGNYGVIENLYSGKLRVIFKDDKKDKALMLKGKINPLECSFVVDVEIQIVKGEPKVYKILKLHDIIE
jgi:hypothetical protein